GGGRKLGKRRVIGERESLYRACLTSFKLVTLIECVTANGNSLPSLFIFSGKRFMKNWLEELHSSVSISENGWMDVVLGYLWFTLVYVPFVKSRPDPNRPCLLILDGYGSHASALIIRYV
ncbi:hypothetical protein BT69DRAFT_1225721, partial [Atractiella rhizophila]